MIDALFPTRIRGVSARGKQEMAAINRRLLLFLTAISVSGALALAAPRPASADTWGYVNSWATAWTNHQELVWFWIQWPPYGIIPVEVTLHFSTSQTMTFWHDFTNGEYLNVYSRDNLGWTCDMCQNLPGHLIVGPSDWDEHYIATSNGWQYSATAYPSNRTPCMVVPGSTCGSGWISIGDGYWDTMNYLYEQVGAMNAVAGWFQNDFWTVAFLHDYTHVYSGI